jgi:hypothetical protein
MVKLCFKSTLIVTLATNPPFAFTEIAFAKEVSTIVGMSFGTTVAI